MADDDESRDLTCPVPHQAGGLVQLAHGGGGRAMANLIDDLFGKAFANPLLNARHDGATFDPGGRIAFTTDSYVVRPLFFPGGDIGTLAVNGTVNDLTMCGAMPLYLSVGFIIEDGLPMADLERIVISMREAAAAASVTIVTGDTKVVECGKADGLFINTSGIGRLIGDHAIGPRAVRPDDVVIVSGDLGRHGIAVMAARENLGFESAIESDCAPVVDPCLALMEAGIAVHCLRDLTRGGLASALVEIAETAGIAITLEEDAIPVRNDVRAACELLGFDPIHVANEGRFIAFVDKVDAERALAILKEHEVSQGAVIAGSVQASTEGQVTLQNAFGSTRAVDMLSGEQLPRIC
ncbi:MAG: hydrogenase expression/formation protein HypE [Alphaproteobacteria bacterium]|nr:hydrogenase expression/formation protein HypE [Alphaproteobacteria bacterium]